jgi:methionyl-tRNA formyltransferase
MGTPDFAVPSLRILVQNGYKVAGVVTATDKYGGRGKKQLLESPVKKYAVEQGIPVLQPKNLKSPEFQEDLRALNANLQVVVAFRMLPETVWDMPEYGTFNLHGSLLPRYRGAAPINWAVINGDTETGVTTFFIRHEIDTGDVLLQEKMPIGPNETAGEVHDRMMMLGAETVLKTVQAIESGNYHLQKQDDAQATKAPKLFRETCEIDFDQPVEKVHNFVRGLSPYPAAWTTLEGKQLKILRAHYKKADVEATPGTFRSDNKSWIKIAALDGWLVIEELQLQGRKRMKANDFLNGFSF